MKKTVEVRVKKPAEREVEDKEESLAKREETESTAPLPIMKKENIAGLRGSEMKKLYENGLVEVHFSKGDNLAEIQEEEPEKEEFLYLCSDRLVSFFDEFHSGDFTYGGLLAIMEFLIKMCSESTRLKAMRRTRPSTRS